MQTLTRLCAGLVLAALATVGTASAQTVSATSQLTGTIDQQLDSGSTQPGTPFTVHLQPPYADDSLSGASVQGHVSHVSAAGQGRKPKISLAFDRIAWPDGSYTPIVAEVVSVNTKSDNKSGARVAASTIGGMIVGNIVGKAIGTNAGGLFGAAGGFLYGNNYKSNINIPAGSTVKLQLDRSLDVQRRQQRTQ